MTIPRLSAIGAGLAFLALGVTSLTGSVPDEHWGTRGDLVNVFGLIGFACTALGAELLRDGLGLGRVGLVGLRVAQLGLTAMTVESVASQLHGGNTLGAVFFLGLLATLLGFLVLGIDGLRRNGARWVALLPVLSFVVGILAGEHGGFLVPGLVWLVLGTAAIGTQPAATATVTSSPTLA